jgi:TrmH family RNA methyltransferase
MQKITSRKNRAVARYRAAAAGELDGQILLDGAHLVGDALASGIRIREAVVAADGLDRAELRPLVDAIGRQGVEVSAASAPVMDAVSPLRSPSAIVAIADRPSEAASRLYSGGHPLVVMVDGVQDPGNLGAIVRVAEAAGAAGFVAAGASAYPFGWKALRGSMGSALRLPILVRPDARGAVDEAVSHRCRIVATVPRGGQSHVDVDLRGPVAIVIGGEGAGLAPDLIAKADLRVTIPMSGRVESLNAGIAAAILLYEARRQRA